MRIRKRYFEDKIKRLCIKNRKMAFISGARQCGKTTMAQRMLKEFDNSLYFNWDVIEDRKLWTKNPSQIVRNLLERAKKRPVILFDEIHKAKNWKGNLKGLYDQYVDNSDFLVTGSARLNVYKKGGDSLLGRYYHFRLHPFSLGEVLSENTPDSDNFLQHLLKISGKEKAKEKKEFMRLLNFSGFPEVYLKQSKEEHRLWQSHRLDKIIREDLRDLSRLPELSQIEMLSAIMPDRVGSPLSLQSLREDLEVSHPTVRRWLNYLESLYYFFSVQPYSKSISRSLKKESKIYLYDWTEVSDPGSRFENMIAVHLQKSCHYWTDIGQGDFELFYLRNKDKKEVDFLVTQDKKPWFSVECKLSDTKLDSSFKSFQAKWEFPHFQVVQNLDRVIKLDEGIISPASIFLSKFV